MKIVLATKSLCRQEAFKFLGLDFIAEGSNVMNILMEDQIYSFYL